MALLILMHGICFLLTIVMFNYTFGKDVKPEPFLVQVTTLHFSGSLSFVMLVSVL